MIRRFRRAPRGPAKEPQAGERIHCVARRCSREITQWTVIFLLAMSVAACAPTPPAATGQDVQRATRGPTAEEVFLARFLQDYGRMPTFDERMAWKDDLEARLLRYLSVRPDLAASPRASQLRFQRMVMVGMRKDDVVTLLDRPDTSTGDEAAMRTAAGRFWGPIRARAKEMWTYPAAWALYFEDDVLVDVTVSDGRVLQ